MPAELAREVHRTVVDLRRARLASTAWPVVAGDLARLDAAIARDDLDAVRAALVPISQATFEGKVRGRLAGADRRSAAVVGTKPNRSLPLVGGLSAIVLVVIGYLLGGMPIAIGTTVLALFVFAVALAGTHTTRERLERRSRTLAPTAEPTELPPTVVTDAIAQIEGRLGRPPAVP